MTEGDRVNEPLPSIGSRGKTADDSRGVVLDEDFVELLRQTLAAVSEGNLDVRMKRPGPCGTVQDVLARSVDLLVERLAERLEVQAEHQARMEALIASATEALIQIGSGDFEARVERPFDGSPMDVLAFLINNTVAEIGDLFSQLERKNVQLETQASRQAVIERTAFSTLTAGVAHELNNPLSFAVGNLDFVQMELEQLQEDGDLRRGPELLQAIAEASEGIERAARITADLKRLAPSVQMTFSRVEVVEVIESALSLIRNRVNHRSRLRCTIDELPPIRADQGRIGQVLVNLVQNALHALPEERPLEDNLIEIVAYRHSEPMVAIEVRDNGEGIAPENLQRIFESFFTTRPVGQGTGLGLALSKRMIADHGGRIEVESERGKGSTFRLVIPIAQAPA